MNKVGTFGVSSAAYYWTRLFGAVGRWACRILHLDKFYMLIYVDGVHVVVYGCDRNIVDPLLGDGGHGDTLFFP